MADKTPQQVAEEITETFINRLKGQLVKFDGNECKETIAQFEHFGYMMIDSYMTNKNINNDFKKNYEAKYQTIANMMFQVGALFMFMWFNDRNTLMSGEYPLVVEQEGPLKFFETVWNGSTIEEYGVFVNSMSAYWLVLMKDYLELENAEEYAREAMIVFFRSGATVFFAWMQKK